MKWEGQEQSRNVEDRRGGGAGLGGSGGVGSGVVLPAGATEWGFDFNPTVDRIRVVNDRGANLRLHPDTGAQVDGNADQPGLQPDGHKSPG